MKQHIQKFIFIIISSLLLTISTLFVFAYYENYENIRFGKILTNIYQEYPSCLQDNVLVESSLASAGYHEIEITSREYGKRHEITVQAKKNIVKITKKIIVHER